jgi:2,3-bisphosphoglycerate-independent phosphoglycerate mutase
VRKICVVLLDGLGDRAYPELGGLSANEAASTPVLDGLCARGSCGLVWPLGPGRAPASEIAHWSMLGYGEHPFPGRAVLEALGRDVPVRQDAVYAFAALRPATVREGSVWLTGRADENDAADCLELWPADEEVGGVTFRCRPFERGEAIVELTGPAADDRLTDTEPFFRDRDPLLRPLPLVEAAAESATAVESWSRRVNAVLREHPVNERRASEGRPPLAALTLKWWGHPVSVPPFAELHGVTGSVAAASPLFKGLARTIGLEFLELSETDDPCADVAARLSSAAERLEGDDTFVWIHLKAVDEAGHTKDPHERVRVLEAIDPALGQLSEPPFSDAVACVTGDHATPAFPEVIHSGDAVPIVITGPGVRADRVSSFGEADCREGLLGRLRGSDLMPLLLNASDRALYAGSRPTPVAGADGHPASPEPLGV